MRRCWKSEHCPLPPSQLPKPSFVIWKWSPTQREPARESVRQHFSWWKCELSRELPLSAFCLVPPKYSAGGSATLRESIWKEILHKGSVALSGIKENQPENRGREILSEANSISGKVPLTPPVTIWLLSSCFSCARLNSRLTSPSAALPLSFHVSPQGVVPVRHQLPVCET